MDVGVSPAACALHALHHAIRVEALAILVAPLEEALDRCALGGSSWACWRCCSRFHRQVCALVGHLDALDPTGPDFLFGGRGDGQSWGDRQPWHWCGREILGVGRLFEAGLLVEAATAY